MHRSFLKPKPFHLLNKGVDSKQIVALVWDAGKADSLQKKGITVRAGDYADYNSLVEVFSGIDKLLLVSSNDRGAVENRTVHHTSVIKAATEASAQHLVYTSFVRKPGFEKTAIAAFQQSHVQTEDFLKSGGLTYTILQNGIYLEMIPVFAGSKVAETGIILYPAQEGKASWVLREELAEAAAHVLTTDGHQNETYPLTNTQSVSFGEIAANIADALGKAVQYQSPSINEFEGILKQAGVPEMYIGMFTMWATAEAEGALDLEDDTLTSFLSRKPVSIKQFIHRLYGKG